MFKPKFKIRTLIAMVSVCCVGFAVSTDWYKKSIRQYEALVKLQSGGKFTFVMEHNVKRNEEGVLGMGSSPLSGIQLLLAKVFDRRVVCAVPIIIFLGQPDDGDLELAKQLKRVERIFVNTTDEELLSEWKREFPDVDVKPLVNTSSRLRGTYTLDADTTIEGLRSSGKYGEEELAGFETMLRTGQQFKFSDSQITTKLGDESTTRNYTVVESGANCLEIESELTADEQQLLGMRVEKSRIEFTAGGLWRTSDRTGFREIYVKQ